MGIKKIYRGRSDLGSYLLVIKHLGKFHHDLAVLPNPGIMVSKGNHPQMALFQVDSKLRCTYRVSDKVSVVCHLDLNFLSKIWWQTLCKNMWKGDNHMTAHSSLNGCSPDNNQWKNMTGLRFAIRSNTQGGHRRLGISGFISEADCFTTCCRPMGWVPWTLSSRSAAAGRGLFWEGNGPYFRLVNYYNVPRNMAIFRFVAGKMI